MSSKGRKGNELYQLFIELTGLEHGAVESELESLMERLGLNPDTLTTDDIRRLMAVYLEEVHSELSETTPMSDPVLDSLLKPPSSQAEA